MILRCTGKLLKELRRQPEEIESSSEAASWHANLLIIERRKCVLFIHDPSYFSVFVAGLKRPDFDHIEQVFGEALFHSLRLAEFSQGQIESLLDSAQEMHVAKTNNRSLLGSMNDLTYQINYFIEMEGGLAQVPEVKLMRLLNHRPRNAPGYPSSVESLHEWLSAQGAV
jgi:hypothetical protein